MAIATAGELEALAAALKVRDRESRRLKRELDELANTYPMRSS